MSRVKAAAFFVAVCASLGVAGCGSSQPATESPEVAQKRAAEQQKAAQSDAQRHQVEVRTGSQVGGPNSSKSGSQMQSDAARHAQEGQH